MKIKKKQVINYKKLIRDKIPEIMNDAGWKAHCRILNKKDYLKEIKNKLIEEAEELVKAKNKDETINEIIDIQELIDTLILETGLTKSQIVRKQKEKKKKRGAFKKRLFLIKGEK